MDKQEKTLYKTQSFLADRELAVFEELQETNENLEEVEVELARLNGYLAGKGETDDNANLFSDDEVKEILEKIKPKLGIKTDADIIKLVLAEIAKANLNKKPVAIDTPEKGIDYFTDDDIQEIVSSVTKQLAPYIPKKDVVEDIGLRLKRLEEYEREEDEEVEEPVRAEEIEGLAEYINVIVSKYVGLFSNNLNQNQNRGGIWSGSANPFAVFDQNGNLIGKDIRSVTFTGSGISSVTNNKGDVTVTVTGSGGSGGGLFAIQDVSGTINGSNKVFTISTAFSGKSFIDLNGQLLTQDTDYTVSGTTVTYTTAPASDLSGTTHKLYYGVASNQTEAFQITFDGSGAALTVGTKNRYHVPFACSISKIYMYADQTGSVVLDIWKDSYANYPATIADTIVASAKPTISSAEKSTDTTLTGWTTTLSADDHLVVNVDSCSSITWLKLVIVVTRT